VQLDISLLETEDELELLIKDRGAGLDLAALRRKAEQRNIQMAHIEDVVFMPGFSTAQQVSDTSGRGVGLSAIKDLADKLQAKVSIRNREEGGSVLRVSWRRMRTEILAAAGG
ncbi:MAG: ATP-binding protein, partial [Pseudobdellovibrionaceae bacterium]|nr:ATP-binding protein [Pseudobdellovibrionaceae bacterium]